MKTSQPNCRNQRTICDDKKAVHRCDGDAIGEVLEECDDECSIGRCTSLACAIAEEQNAARGCLFFGAQVDNVDEDDRRNLMLMLSNSEVVSAQVEVQVRDPAGSWIALATTTVPLQDSKLLEVTRPVTTSGVSMGGGFRVVSDIPIMVAELVDDDADRLAHSSGGTALLPYQSLGSAHMVLAFPELGTDAVIGTLGSRQGAGAIALVAAVDHTNVRLRFTTGVDVGTGDRLDPPPPEGYDVTLQAGDVFQAFSAHPGGDLTGTTIVSDGPLSVLVGNVFTTYGYPLAGAQGGDMTLEQLPPTVAWGEKVVGAWLAPPPDCDPFFGPDTGRWRLIAAQNDTVVTLSPAPGVMIDPPVLTMTLASGTAWDFTSRPMPPPADASPGAPGIAPDLVATSNRGGILLAQMLDCEPGLSFGIDTRTPITNGDRVDFVLPPSFVHELVVVRQTAKQTSLSFDNRPVTQFTPTGDPTLEIARIHSPEIARCADVTGECAHQLVGNVLGLAWRGTDVVCGYSLSLPPTSVCAIAYRPCLQD